MSGTGPLDFDPPERDPEPERDLRHREDPDLHTLPARSARARFGPGTIGAIALLAFVLFVSASVFLSRDDGPGARGLETGAAAPEFSAPLVDGPTKDEFEVNVLERSEDGHPAACDVRGPNAVNACALSRRMPLAVVFFTTNNDACVRQVDLVERLRPRYDEVAFVAISLGGERGRARELKRARGWGMPVGYDLSGTLSALYGVAVCPHITFVRRGGEVARTDIGELDEAGLRSRLDALAAGKPIPVA